MKALEAANYLIEISNYSSESDLTNLKLQKVLFYAQGLYLAENGKPLFEDDILAWRYGPVIQEVYDTYKSFGAYQLSEFEISAPYKLSNEHKLFLDKIWTEIGSKYTAAYLVNKTHITDGPWHKVYSREQGAVIPLVDLEAFFTENPTL